MCGIVVEKLMAMKSEHRLTPEHRAIHFLARTGVSSGE